MKLIFALALCIVIIVILLLFLFGIVRTIQTQHNPQQQEFLGGGVPKEMPNGLYKGSVTGLKTTWQGKRFDRARKVGINVFKNGNTIDENYPFKMYVGVGIQDKNRKVLKIDYSANAQPFWLKYILDEVVEVSPNKYLGKVHVLLIPGLPFTLGYFRLEK